MATLHILVYLFKTMHLFGTRNIFKQKMFTPITPF